MLVCQNSFIFLEKIRKQRSLSFLRKKLSEIFPLEHPRVVQPNQKLIPYFDAFKERKSTTDEESKRSNLVLIISALPLIVAE